MWLFVINEFSSTSDSLGTRQCLFDLSRPNFQMNSDLAVVVVVFLTPHEVKCNIYGTNKAVVI